jgi:hypothetical protein
MFKDDVIFYQKVNEKLNEGITFFKNSGRIEKLVRKIKVRSTLIRDIKSKEELNSFCNNLLKIAPQFRNLESEYEEAESKEEKRTIKEKYAFLEEKYRELINSINKESFFKAVKIANVSLFVATIVGILVFALLGKPENFYQNDNLPKIKYTIAKFMEKNNSSLLNDTGTILSKI